MHKIAFFSTILLLLIGCGGGGGSKADETMVKGTQYTVDSGDQVIKNVDNTLIKIIHTDGDSKSTIELVEGNATIIYKK